MQVVEEEWYGDLNPQTPSLFIIATIIFPFLLYFVKRQDSTEKKIQERMERNELRLRRYVVQQQQKLLDDDLNADEREARQKDIDMQVERLRQEISVVSEARPSMKDELKMNFFAFYASPVVKVCVRALRSCVVCVCLELYVLCIAVFVCVWNCMCCVLLCVV